MGRLQHVVLTGWRAFDPRCADTVFVHVKATLNTPNAVIELEASQKRYRNLISFCPSVWQIDARPAGRIFDRLRASGITDIATYSDEHPELVELHARLYKFSTSTTKPCSFSGEASLRIHRAGKVSVFKHPRRDEDA